MKTMKGVNGVKPRDLALGALLTALALIIPLVFSFLRVVIPPFSATLASHVPSMIGMFISPAVAALIGIGSTIGFLIALGPVIAARAFIHVIFGVLGAYLYKGGMAPWLVLAAVLVPHALGEALVVVPFGFDLYKAGVVVGVGTALHHIADSIITLVILAILRSMNFELAAGKTRSAS